MKELDPKMLADVTGGLDRVDGKYVFSPGDSFRRDDCIFLVMEPQTGENLNSLIRCRMYRKSAPASYEDVEIVAHELLHMEPMYIV